MGDVMLRAVTKAKVRFGGWVRGRSGDRGQTAVEYLGIIVVVVAIVIAITGTDIGNTIKNAITTKIATLTK
ncbi:Flp family type IVb pilin [Streptomyces sp. NPDC003035]|uniref:Flp family type IVb pilin n=1 Tax=Streptomyces sp. NPDC003035 TaxID=3364676 RepID=UPI00368B5425